MRVDFDKFRTLVADDQSPLRGARTRGKGNLRVLQPD